ncbi:MAG: hypothetical protein WA162_02735 [Thermodesulfobacteriota bacterium]
MRKVKANDDIFFTVTMAEVLEKQNRLDDALMIYKILLDSKPNDDALKQSIERLKGRGKGYSKG